eukprot:scaffold18413_cov19-Tisochrysis_lutea.AAC.3
MQGLHVSPALPNVRHVAVQGVDWASLNVEGQPLKPDQLTDAWTACEPSDAPPPGALGPEQMGASIRSPMQYALDLSGDEASGSYVMLAIGRTGVLGGVWRAPPLALAEYSTTMAEGLQVGGHFASCNTMQAMPLIQARERLALRVGRAYLGCKAVNRQLAILL